MSFCPCQKMSDHRPRRRAPTVGGDGDAYHGEPESCQHLPLHGSSGYTYNAHALPRTDHGCNSNKEANGREHSIATASVAQSDEDCGHNTSKDAENTKASCKDNARSIAIADGPADEVRMCLVTKSPFNCVDDITEC